MSQFIKPPRNEGETPIWRRVVSSMLSNIVGTVSQTNGVSTGAIIESGSNANGNYTKWADGTMICTGSVDLTKGTSTTQTTWTFPAPFIDSSTTVTVNMNGRTVDGGSGRTAYSMCVYSVSSTQCYVLLSLLENATAQTGSWVDNRVTAVGRWY